MGIVYLGTSPFAAVVLERLAAVPSLRPALVVTRPDRPSGRGRRLHSPPVADTARALGLELSQPPRVNDPQAVDRIDRAAAAGEGREVLVVCAFGALIGEALLARHSILNVHPSLLPRWRGAAPVERAIMAGDPVTGVSIMRLTAGLDEGPVGLAASEPIASDDTYGSLSARLEELGARLLIEALQTDPVFVEQDESGASYAEKIGPADRLLDPHRPAAELERAVRALHPHIGARLALADGRWLGVSRAAVAVAAGPGEGKLAEHDGRLLLGCSEGALELLVVQPPGGRAMDAADFLRGHGVPQIGPAPG